MKIAVTGATGQLGRLVVEQLKSRASADNIVALVRTPEKALDLGINARAFDYNQAEGLEEALNGIDTLLLISGSEVGQRATQHSNIIEAAKKAGIKWIVYTSLLHADTTSLSLAGEHLATEKMLKESGIEHTILRNGWYTENYIGSIEGALAGGALIGSAGDGKISSAARADYAEAAAVVLTNESHKGNVYELAGDDYYTLSDLAKEVSKQSGKDIPYKNLPEADYANALKSFGMDETFAGIVAGWDVSTSKDDLFDDSHQLSKLIGRATTPMADTVKAALK